MKRNKFILVSVAVLLGGAAAIGWNSVGGVNHRQLTIDAVAEISSDEYPDINKFYGGGNWYGSSIVDGSGTEASHNAPFPYDPDEVEAVACWDVPNNHWINKALISYKARNYTGGTSCYFRLGYELHIRQDRSVPAHELKLYHSALGQDKYEYKADLMQAESNFNYGLAEPYGYNGYTGLYKYRKTTITDVEYDLVPQPFKDYFLRDDSDGKYFLLFPYFLGDSSDDDNNDESIADANDTATDDGVANEYPDARYKWGTYGKGVWSFTASERNMIPGINRGGILQYSNMPPLESHDNTGDWFDDTEIDNQLIKNYMISSKLKEARDASVTIMKAFSDSLPPVVYGLTEAWDSTAKVVIFRFVIEENRTPDVKVTIKLEVAGNEQVVVDTNDNSWSEKTLMLTRTSNSDTSVLPFRTSSTDSNNDTQTYYELRWNPREHPLPGHDKTDIITLSIAAKDGDGHNSEEATMVVNIDINSGKSNKKNWLQNLIGWLGL